MRPKSPPLSERARRTKSLARQPSASFELTYLHSINRVRVPLLAMFRFSMLPMGNGFIGKQGCCLLTAETRPDLYD
jgi:hypothetical protein